MSALDLQPLPQLKRALRARYGCQVDAWLNPDAINSEPVQTVIFDGDDDLLLPACVPPEVRDREDYVDEYGTSWYRLPWRSGGGRGWHVIQHVAQNGTAAPFGARHWPLKWCEKEVARLLQRLGRRAMANTRGAQS